MIGSLSLHRVTRIDHQRRVVLDKGISGTPYAIHHLYIHTDDGSRFTLSLFSDFLSIEIPPASVDAQEIAPESKLDADVGICEEVAS